MMVEAKLLRKKLKNGLIVDKWDLVNIIEQQADRIEKLEKQSEPVAYRHLHEDGWEYYDTPTGEDCKECYPLYTTPQTKPLSDEEIEQVIKTFQLDSLMKNLDYKDFARAIEAKVRGEK